MEKLTDVRKTSQPKFCGNGILILTRLKESVGKKVFLCASVKILRVSVVKLLQKTLTTEAQRSHRGTEIIFPDRLLQPGGKGLALFPKPFLTVSLARSSSHSKTVKTVAKIIKGRACTRLKPGENETNHP